MSDRTFGVQLRRWRQRAGIDQRIVGEATGATQQTVSGWERGIGVAKFNRERFALLDAVLKLEPGTVMQAWLAAKATTADQDETADALLDRMERLEARIDALEARGRSAAPKAATKPAPARSAAKGRRPRP